MKEASSQQLLPDVIRFPVYSGNKSKTNSIIALSSRQGLGIAETYPDAISGIRELADQFAGQEYLSARKAAQELVTLPVHGFISPRDRERIIDFLHDSGLS